MPPHDPDLPPVTDTSESPDYLIDNSVDVQRVSLRIYRRLAEGTPVSQDELADDLGMDETSVSETLKTFPPSVIDFDEQNRIVGFIGLSISPTNHRILVQNKTLYTWCVLDALFLSEILGSDVTVKTNCPASNDEIEVHVTPTGVVLSDPPEAVMSVVAPDAQSCRADLRSAFCNHVSFFQNEALYRKWARGKSRPRCVDLQTAFEMAQARNRMRYPDVEYFA